MRGRKSIIDKNGLSFLVREDHSVAGIGIKCKKVLTNGVSIGTLKKAL